MKQLLFCFSFICFFATTSFAQNNNQDLQLEIEKLQNDMKSAMQDFEFLFGTIPTSLDSIDFQQLGLEDIDKADIEDLMGNLLPQGTNIDLDDMLQQLEKEMQGIDMQQFESLFKQFGLDQPAIPAPDQLEDGKSTSPTEKKKERKKYSM